MGFGLSLALGTVAVSSAETPTQDNAYVVHEVEIPYLSVPLPDVMIIEVTETTTTTVVPVTEALNTTLVAEKTAIMEMSILPNPALSIESGIPMSLPENYDTWIKMANCESTLKWHINTGNGFFGGLQFTQESWENVGGLEDALHADLATPLQQMNRANMLRKLQGWGAWPDCADKLGLPT
ncbi:hypothetical protein BH10PAT3_BH10PAT3_5280 [soil metagenome]